MLAQDCYCIQSYLRATCLNIFGAWRTRTCAADLRGERLFLESRAPSRILLGPFPLVEGLLDQVPSDKDPRLGDVSLHVLEKAPHVILSHIASID